MRHVEQKQEQDWAENAALLRQGNAQAKGDDADRSLKEGIADTGQGAH